MGSSDPGAVVWVVDDSPLVADRARRVLDGRYTVKVFLDGSAMLEQLATHRAPAVLVLDWVMPGVSGIEVCRFLRAGGNANAQIAILLLTMQTETQQIVEGLAAGANDYLVKPYSDPELLARVDALVRSKTLLDRAQAAEASVVQLLEHAPDPLLGVDENFLVSYVNREAQRTFRREAHGAPAARHRGGEPDLLPDHPLPPQRGPRRPDHRLAQRDGAPGEGVAAPGLLLDHRPRPALAAGGDVDADRDDVAGPSRRAVGGGDRGSAQDGQPHAQPGGADQRLPGLRAHGRGGPQDRAGARRSGRADSRDRRRLQAAGGEHAAAPGNRRGVRGRGCAG